MSKKRPAKSTDYPKFLRELLEAKSPTGHEFAAQAVIDAHVEKSADKYERDAIGNRIATLKGTGGPTLMFAGHIDEIGLIVSHVDDRGYLYFEFLGGHDQVIPSGRRVHILTRQGPVLGVTGKRAVHLLSPEDRKRVPERHDMWIDIGVTNRTEALAIVQTRCASCHAALPTDASIRVAPKGVHLETLEELKRYAAQIETQAVKSKAMPLGNRTGMLDEERAKLGTWIAKQ